MPTTYPFSELQAGGGSTDYAIAIPNTDAQSIIDVTKAQIGTAYDKPYYPNSLVDMRPAGIDELWSMGWRQRLLKYDLQLNLKSVVNTYNAPRPNNNYCFPWDMVVDFTNGLVFVPCWSYNVVRVYDLQAFIDETYVRGANATGGHLYDIGLANGTSNWFRADKGSATRNGEGGALYNVASCDIDGAGKLLIACYQGYGNASATSNTGFIAQYSYTGTGATFERIIAANTGTYPNADTIVKTTFRHPYGKLRFRPGTRTFVMPSSNHSNNGFGYHEIDLDNLAAGSLERRTFPTDNTITDSWRPHSTHFDSNGNLLVTNRAAANAVVEENVGRELLSVAMVPVTSEVESDGYYRLQWPMAAIKLEAVNGRDWLVAADYSTHKISMMPFPTGNIDGEAVVDVGLDFVAADGQPASFPTGKTLVKQYPPNAVVDVAAQTAQLPLGTLGSSDEIVMLLS